VPEWSKGTGLGPVGEKLLEKVSEKDLLEEFRQFLRVDLQRAQRTAYMHTRYIRYFLQAGPNLECVTRKDIRHWLSSFRGGGTYKNRLSALKLFFRDFLERGDLVRTFKFPRKQPSITIVPTKQEVRKFYDALETDKQRSIFLLFATTGLRRMELLRLTFDDVDFDKRMVIPSQRQSMTKQTWVSFYNREAEEVLDEYLNNRRSSKRKLFPYCLDNYNAFWKRAYQRTGIHITAQVLREFFGEAMGNLGIQDRYVDCFCGRVPATILAKNYTDFSPRKLREVYNRANLKVLV
jgi:integrase